MIGVLYIILLPFSILIGASTPLIFTLTFSWFINLFITYKYIFRKSIYIFFSYFLLLFLVNNTGFLDNLNVIVSLIALSLSSSTFVNEYKNRKKNSYNWIYIALLMLFAASLINRFFFPYITVSNIEGSTPSFAIAGGGGWYRDGLFGANIVLMSVCLFNIFLIKRRAIFEIFESLVLALIYQSRLPILLLLPLSVNQFSKILKFGFSKFNKFTSYLFIIFSISFFSILGEFLLNNSENRYISFRRCGDINNECLTRFDRVLEYINLLLQIPDSEFFFGLRSNDIQTFNSIQLTDNSFLEVFISIGLIGFIYLFYMMATNLYFSFKLKDYDLRLIVLDVAFVLFLSTYTVIRMVPVVLIYSSLRIKLISEN